MSYEIQGMAKNLYEIKEKAEELIQVLDEDNSNPVIPVMAEQVHEQNPKLAGSVAVSNVPKKEESARLRATRNYDKRQGLRVKSFKMKITDAEAFGKACQQKAESQVNVITRLMGEYVASTTEKLKNELEDLRNLCVEQKKQIELQAEEIRQLQENKVKPSEIVESKKVKTIKKYKAQTGTKAAEANAFLDEYPECENMPRKEIIKFAESKGVEIKTTTLSNVFKMRRENKSPNE